MFQLGMNMLIVLHHMNLDIAYASVVLIWWEILTYPFDRNADWAVTELYWDIPTQEKDLTSDALKEKEM